MTDPIFILKTTPPRVPRTALPRERLTRRWAEVRERAVLSVSAPAGFGKTTLMTQWRRLWLEQGAIVAWSTLDANDDPSRFASLLLYAMRVASGRAAFDRLLREHAEAPVRGVGALTGLLAEVAALATPTVLMLDDVERLRDATREDSLLYLLLNAPPNLHVVVGARGALRIPIGDLAGRGQLGEVRADDLRLDLHEAVSILEKRFGTRLSLDDCVRLHEATEGWPLGLQLAATAIERSPDLHRAVETLSARHGDIERYFVESSFSRLPPEIADFLVRIAILDDCAPELCAAVTGCADAGARLERLSAESPMVVVGEMRGWMRIHGLGRDFLLGRFEQLPAGEQRELHRRAADWLARHGRFHEAGRHALAAGAADLARGYAKRCLWALASEGRLREARQWLEQLPDDALAGDDALRLVAAWIMALGNRPQAAIRVAEQVYATPAASESTRAVAALVSACGAAYLDRPGLIARWLATLPDPPPAFGSPVYEAAWANTRAMLAIYGGATDSSRMLEAPYAAENDPLSLALALGRTIVGFSHLWDGDNHKADAVLRPALAAAERHAGRRSVHAALFAAPLAAACYDQGDAAEARALLANRLDVIEQTGLPDSITLAYRVLAAVALQQGDERGALDTLGTLHEIGRARAMPRMALTSLCDQLRVHATRLRAETATALLGPIDALAPSFDEPDFLPFRPLCRLMSAISRAYVALARSRFDEAGAELDVAEGLSAQLRRGRIGLVVKTLRAVLAAQSGGDGSALLREVIGLMEIRGSRRLLADTHPLAVTMAAAIQGGSTARAAVGAPSTGAAETSPHRPALVAAPGGLLTPKEAEVLRLLNGGLSNKLIGKSMGISDQTVKWHLKNLFSKLNAGTRKHAVDRARLLGLVAA